MTAEIMKNPLQMSFCPIEGVCWWSSNHSFKKKKEKNRYWGRWL